LISPNPPNTLQIRSTENQTILKAAEDNNTSIHNLRPRNYTMEDQISTLHSIELGDYSNEEGIQALPRRRPKSQRPLAMQLANTMYPEDTDIAAIIKYERLISLAKSIVRNKQKTRLASKSQARMLQIQGPWAGQVFDPVDLKGPEAIPMPVKIGKADDFAPIFQFLAHESFEDANRDGFRPNLEFLKRNEEFTGNVWNPTYTSATSFWEIMRSPPLVPRKSRNSFENILTVWRLGILQVATSPGMASPFSFLELSPLPLSPTSGSNVTHLDPILHLYLQMLSFSRAIFGL